MRYEVEAEVTRLGILAGLTALIVGVAWLTLKRRKPKEDELECLFCGKPVAEEDQSDKMIAAHRDCIAKGHAEVDEGK
jgi:hypothetical protein